jgi:hypothetical protein
MMIDSYPRRLPSIDALADPASLGAVIGPVIEVRETPFTAIGFSNAAFSRVEAVNATGASRRFVLKRTRLDRDWIARRTGDLAGREALLLDGADLTAVWDAFACPYVAFASGISEIGLLLDDLTAGLLPDVRLPLRDDEELALLGGIARLHARFWDRGVPRHDWLARVEHYCDLLAPSVATDPDQLSSISSVLQSDVARGWNAALQRLPAPVVRQLTCPASEWQERWATLPQTLLHGDVKVANFALLDDGRVAAFDWAMVGTGPCAIDLGWYLAVNASRLTRPKDDVISRYRVLLEAALDRRLDAELWSRLEQVAVVCGARMLLWSKALAVENHRPGADDEWDWWIGRLER